MVEPLGPEPSPCWVVQLQEFRALLVPSHSWLLRTVRPRNRNVLVPSPLGWAKGDPRHTAAAFIMLWAIVMFDVDGWKGNFRIAGRHTQLYLTEGGILLIICLFFFFYISHFFKMADLRDISYITKLIILKIWWSWVYSQNCAALNTT